jgi:hypothetical protein
LDADTTRHPSWLTREMKAARGHHHHPFLYLDGRFLQCRLSVPPPFALLLRSITSVALGGRLEAGRLVHTLSFVPAEPVVPLPGATSPSLADPVAPETYPGSGTLRLSPQQAARLLGIVLHSGGMKASESSQARLSTILKGDTSISLPPLLGSWQETLQGSILKFQLRSSTTIEELLSAASPNTPVNSHSVGHHTLITTCPTQPAGSFLRPSLLHHGDALLVASSPLPLLKWITALEGNRQPPPRPPSEVNHPKMELARFTLAVPNAYRTVYRFGLNRLLAAFPHPNIPIEPAILPPLEATCGPLEATTLSLTQTQMRYQLTVRGPGGLAPPLLYYLIQNATP